MIANPYSIVSYFKNQRANTLSNGLHSKSGNHFYGYADAAEKLGVKMVMDENNKNRRLFYHAGKEIGFLNRMTPSNTVGSAVRTCRDKSKTLQLLKNGGATIANSKSFPSLAGLESAIEYFKSCTYDVVVKPSDAAAGMGITVGVAGVQDFIKAWHYARENLLSDKSSIIVEQRLKGIDVRVVIVNGVYACSAVRLPAYVVGDGESELEKLIAIKNDIRALNPYHKTRPILDCGSYGLDPNQKPGLDEVLFLTSKGNIHQGGESIDVTSLLSEQAISHAKHAASLVPGLSIAGVDLMLSDFDSDPGCVLEINTSCNFAMHYSPMFGCSHNPALLVVSDMLKSKT